ITGDTVLCRASKDLVLKKLPCGRRVCGSTTRRLPMFVRVARFENASGDVEKTIAEIRSRMESGIQSESAPAAKRSMMLVDRDNRRGLALSFCETEADLRKMDEFLNAMDVPVGAGTRTGVEMYEVAVDSREFT